MALYATSPPNHSNLALSISCTSTNAKVVMNIFLSSLIILYVLHRHMPQLPNQVKQRQTKYLTTMHCDFAALQEFIMIREMNLKTNCSHNWKCTVELLGQKLLPTTPNKQHHAIKAVLTWNSNSCVYHHNSRAWNAPYLRKTCHLSRRKNKDWQTRRTYQNLNYIEDLPVDWAFAYAYFSCVAL